MQTQDPADWIPKLLIEHWATAVDALVADGFDVPHHEPPIARGAKTRGSVQAMNRCLIKAYRASDLNSSPISWGDTDRDLTVSWGIQAEASGPRAPSIAYSAELVIDRILQMHRKYPQADWERFQSWRIIKIEDYPDYQRLGVTVVLERRGRVMAVPVQEL